MKLVLIKTCIVFLLVHFGSLSYHAQSDNSCLEEIISIEEAIFKDRKDDVGVLFLNYKVITTDWDNKLINSDVKIYKDEVNTHFFSERAIIYQDTSMVFMIIKDLQLITLGSTPRKTEGINSMDGFYEMRKVFLENCLVLECKSLEDGLTRTTLKLDDVLAEQMHIDRMIYTYDKKKHTLNTTTITYRSEYKIKQITINYVAMESDYAYSFKPAHKYVLDRKGQILSKYSSFEFVDNR